MYVRCPAPIEKSTTPGSGSGPFVICSDRAEIVRYEMHPCIHDRGKEGIG